jgi:hypothetical protein
MTGYDSSNSARFNFKHNYNCPKRSEGLTVESSPHHAMQYNGNALSKSDSETGSSSPFKFSAL